ncbi:MAG: TetR/AcrR family transcriptional regulator [Bacteroidales bacterium]
MKTKKPTRKERQAELLKKEILDAALVVFKEYGFEKATTKKIAERAEVSEGTLYNYFKNKRDILISLFKIIKERTSNNITILPNHAGDINKLLSASLSSQFNKKSTLSIFTLLLHEADHDPHVQKIFSEQVKAIRKSRIDFFKQFENTGKIRKVNATTIAILINTITFGYITMIESGDKELAKIPINKLANEITDILVNGLVPAMKKGKAEFKDEILSNQNLS